MIRALSILALAGALAFGACGGPSSSGDAASAEVSAAQDEERPVQIEGFRLVETANGDRQVMGTLQNRTAEAIENAQVQISLYDANNVRIDSMSVTVRDIPAEGEAEFKQSLDTDKPVAGARVRSVLVM